MTRITANVIATITATITLFITLAAPALAEKPRAPLTCRAVGDLDASFTPGAVVLFGELHGTQEAPEFIANAACLTLDAGHRVRIALEIWQEEAESIEVFLNSAGKEADRKALLEGAFWQRDYHDGRTSHAMVDLLDKLRYFRSGGHSVSVTLFDSSKRHNTGQERDRAMAKRLAESIQAHPQDVLLALMGNIHSRVAQGTPWDAEYEPLGFLLAPMISGRSLLALDQSWSGGAAWNCRGSGTDSCREYPVGPRAEGEDWRCAGERREDTGQEWTPWSLSCRQTECVVASVGFKDELILLHP